MNKTKPITFGCKAEYHKFRSCPYDFPFCSRRNFVRPASHTVGEAANHTQPKIVFHFRLVNFEPQLRASPLSQQIISSILNNSHQPSTSSTPRNRASSIVHSSSRPFLQRRKKTIPPLAAVVVVSLDLTRSQN